MSSRVVTFMSSFCRSKTTKVVSLEGVQTVTVDILKLIDAGVYVTVLRVGDNRIVKTFTHNDHREPVDLSWVMLSQDWKASIDVQSLSEQERSNLLHVLSMEGVDCVTE